MLEVVYIGNHAVHLPIDYTQLNGHPALQYLSTLGTRDANQNYLTAPWPTRSPACRPARTPPPLRRFSLLARIPNSRWATAPPAGAARAACSSRTSTTAAPISRASTSASKNALPTASRSCSITSIRKMMEQITWLNDSDPVPEKRVSPIDHPQRFVTAITYELPIGKGKALDFHSRLANSLLGGWLLNNVYTYQVGGPMHVGQRQLVEPRRLRLFRRPAEPRQPSGQRPAFNTAVFDAKSADTFQLSPAHLLDHVLQPARRRHQPVGSVPFQALRDSREKASVQLRMEAYNVLNHPVFAAPSAPPRQTPLSAPLRRPPIVSVRSKL
jgi:hypothetical protein